MKEHTIYNVKSKEKFADYLKRVGYEGSVDDFRIFHINYKPWEEEDEIEDDEDDDFDPYDISYAR